MRRAEGGANIFGVFRVKNHDFTPKNHIFSNFRGGEGRWVHPPWILPLLIGHVVPYDDDHDGQYGSIRYNVWFSMFLSFPCGYYLTSSNGLVYLTKCAMYSKSAASASSRYVSKHQTSTSLENIITSLENMSCLNWNIGIIFFFHY